MHLHGEATGLYRAICGPGLGNRCEQIFALLGGFSGVGISSVFSHVGCESGRVTDGARGERCRADAGDHALNIGHVLKQRVELSALGGIGNC